MRHLLTGVALLLASLAASAGEIAVTWTMPTAYEDGAALPLTSIKASEVQWGTCASGAMGQVLGTSTVLAPAAQATIPSLATGTYCVRVRVLDTLNTAGTWSAVASKVILQVPKAPVVVLR